MEEDEKQSFHDKVRKKKKNKRKKKGMPMSDGF